MKIICGELLIMNLVQSSCYFDVLSCNDSYSAKQIWLIVNFRKMYRVYLCYLYTFIVWIYFAGYRVLCWLWSDVAMQNHEED